MSKKIVDALKAKTEKSEYSYLRAAKEKSKQDWNSSYNITYNDLITEPKLTVNGQEITKKSIEELYSKHESLILQDENGKENYRLFLKAVFTEMFWRAGAKIPNNSIMEELITYYNRSGYMGFFSFQDQALQPFGLGTSSSEFPTLSYKERIYMSCDDPDCLKFNFSINEGIYGDHKGFICNLHNSVEFKLKCKDGNVTYEDGKVSLVIPRELKDYKVNDKNLFDIIVEYFQKICEKLGFKFETKIEHSLGKPLKVVSEANASSVEDLKLKVNNPR